MPLAIETYQAMPSLKDEPDHLNLAWTLDERDCLAVDLHTRLFNEIGQGLKHVETYLVNDPYGEFLMAPALDRYFGGSLGSASVTCGAGVGSLLSALARLTCGRPLEIVSETHPDFPFWVRQAGGKAMDRGERIDADGLTARLAGCAGGIVFFERPALREDILEDLGALREYCVKAARHGVDVVIDESNANYCPPSFSAALLVDGLDNLVVLRGLTKAYGMGGLRIGYCIASAALRESIRATIPPLLPSSLSLHLARTILELGDITSTLRSTIASRKKEVRTLLAGVGLCEVRPASAHLPYILLDDGPTTGRRLEQIGIRGKLHPLWNGMRDTTDRVYRLSLPLADSRMDLLRSKLSAAASG